MLQSHTLHALAGYRSLTAPSPRTYDTLLPSKAIYILRLYEHMYIYAEYASMSIYRGKVPVCFDVVI